MRGYAREGLRRSKWRVPLYFMQSSFLWCSFADQLVRIIQSYRGSLYIRLESGILGPYLRKLNCTVKIPFPNFRDVIFCSGQAVLMKTQRTAWCEVFYPVVLKIVFSSKPRPIQMFLERAQQCFLSIVNVVSIFWQYGVTAVSILFGGRSIF